MKQHCAIGPWWWANFNSNWQSSPPPSFFCHALTLDTGVAPLISFYNILIFAGKASTHIWFFLDVSIISDSCLHWACCGNAAWISTENWFSLCSASPHCAPPIYMALSSSRLPANPWFPRFLLEETLVYEIFYTSIHGLAVTDPRFQGSSLFLEMERFDFLDVVKPCHGIYVNFRRRQVCWVLVSKKKTVYAMSNEFDTLIQLNWRLSQYDLCECHHKAVKGVLMLCSSASRYVCGYNLPSLHKFKR